MNDSFNEWWDARMYLEAKKSFEISTLTVDGYVVDVSREAAQIVWNASRKQAFINAAQNIMFVICIIAVFVIAQVL